MKREISQVELKEYDAPELIIHGSVKKITKKAIQANDTDGAPTGLSEP